MRTGVSFTVGPDDQRRLKAIVADRNTKQKHVWRARIIPESKPAPYLIRGSGQASKAHTATAPWKSCAERASQKTACGAGKGATCSKV